MKCILCVCVRERGEGKENIRFKNSFKTVKWSRVLGLCVLIGIASGEESNVWAVAGDQVILTLTGIDQTKLASVSLLGYMYALIVSFLHSSLVFLSSSPSDWVVCCVLQIHLLV